MPDDQKEEDSEVDVGDEAADTVKSEGVDHTNEATLRMSERYADPTADLRIISSDGVELKLHSYHLNSAS